MRGELLLLSNSVVHGGRYLEHARGEIAEVLGDRRRLLFFPFASSDHDGYARVMQDALDPLGIRVEGVHQVQDVAAAVRDAEAIFVGGGNSFRLLRTLRDLDLLAVMRAQVERGAPYLGASAGSNVACPTIRTTNDMPIVEVGSLDALGLIPFQINPHYLDPRPDSTHMGETREQRLLQFLEENDVPVLGLREGSWLRVAHGRAVLGGKAGARLFRRGQEPSEHVGGADFSWLLGTDPRFDAQGIPSG